MTVVTSLRPSFLNPNFAFFYNNRGLVFHGQGDHVRAVTDFDHAICLNPDKAKAYYNRGNAYSALGDHAMVILDFDQAVRLDPDDASAYYNRSNSIDNPAGRSTTTSREFKQGESE